MRNIKINVLAGLLLASSAAFAGISGSPHDLSTSATGIAENGELCVFCHTPHAANTNMPGAPLWNKAVPTGATFTLYGATIAGNSTDTAGADFNAIGVNNQSLACLSCHDGVSSIDSIVNAPGSGLNSVTAVDSDIQIQDIGTYQGVANLTRTLTNTHPISIEYIPGNASLRPVDTNLTDTPGYIQAWSGATAISDLLRGAGADRVECGSCHDPHNGYGATASNLYGTGVNDRTTEVNFLRHSNKASALCLGCHGK